MRCGAYDFLLKPVRVDQLDAVLTRCSQWIRHRRSHAELEEVNRRLLELSRLKERFLAVTDHELRTPVTVLDGMLGLLVRQGEELPEQTRERLQSLSQVSRRLVHLVRDIHDLLKWRTESFRLDLCETTVRELVEGVELDFELARFNRDLELWAGVDLPAEYSFAADGLRMRQAVTELIQNAVKATPDGGRVAVRILGQEEAGGKRVCVSVADTGVGIPTEQQTRIFDIFYGVGDELHHHTSKFDFMGSGLGIGLSIALEIAKAHGGGIDLQSEEGRGSTFTLWVPAG
jgi:signal transduction histidine kinase